MNLLAPAICLAVCAIAFDASAAQAPAGQSYKLTISASFEAPFTDCWTFASNGKYIASFNGLGSFPYQLTGLNTNANHVQAVWRGGVSIAFSAVTNGSTITGDGVDSRIRTYSFAGSKVSGCGAGMDRVHAWRRQ